MPRLRSIAGAIDLETAARSLAAFAALANGYLEQLTQQALHDAADFRAGMHGRGEETPMATDDEPAIASLDLVQRSQILEKVRGCRHPLGKIAPKARALRGEPPPDQVHHLIELVLWQSLLKDAHQVGDEGNVRLGKDGIGFRGELIYGCRPGRAPLESGLANDSIVLQRGEMPPNRVVSQPELGSELG